MLVLVVSPDGLCRWINNLKEWREWVWRGKWDGWWVTLYYLNENSFWKKCSILALGSRNMLKSAYTKGGMDYDLHGPDEELSG